MATKTFEELKQMAIQIRDEKANKQNTATRIGTQMVEHLNKLEQEYYNKENIDEQKEQTDAKFSELESDYKNSIGTQASIGRFNGLFNGVLKRTTAASSFTDWIEYYINKGDSIKFTRKFNSSSATNTVSLKYDDDTTEIINITNDERVITPSKNVIAIKIVMHGYVSEDLTEMEYSIQSIDDIRNYFSTLNISQLYPQGGADGDNIYTFSDALKKVPELYRKEGLIITFKDKEGFWQTWKNIGEVYSYDTVTNWVLIDYSSRGYTEPTELAKRKRNLEKSLTILYNIGGFVKDGVIPTLKTISNKYLSPSIGITDHDAYNVIVKDVTDIDMILIEGVSLGDVSNYAFSLDENLNSIIETCQSDRTYPNGVICKPYPNVKYLALSVKKEPLAYPSAYKLKDNNIITDKFQQKSDSVKLLQTSLFSLNFGEYNERLQSVVNNLSYNTTDSLPAVKEIDNYYLLINEYVDKLAAHESYTTKLYDISDLECLYVKIENIRNVTPYAFLNNDIMEDNYDNLKDFVVYSPNWLTVEKQYEGILLKPLGAKYLIMTEHKTQTKPQLKNVQFNKVNSSKLSGKTYWTIFDSLGASNKWQSKFTELSGANFYPELNSNNKNALSYGGSNSYPQGDNGGQARLRILEKLKGQYPIDYIFYENVNDIPSTPTISGSIEDAPFMRSEKLVILKNGTDKFTSSSDAKSYFSTNKDTILNSVETDKRKAGVILDLPYENTSVEAGYTIKFTSIAKTSGTVYVVKGGSKFGIDVTPQMTIKDLVDAVLNYSYGAGWSDSAVGDDSVAIYYYQADETVISFDANGTGITTEITRCGTIGHVYKYFTGYSATEWLDAEKWVDRMSLYSTYKGIIEFIKTTFPIAKLYWFIPPRYNVPLDASADYTKADGTFDIIKYQQTDDYKRYKALTDCQKEVCKLYDVPVLDIEVNCNINLFNLSAYYSSNNVHPKDEGYYRWGETTFELIG